MTVPILEEPPETVKPLDVAKPPVETPPLKVEVEFPETVILLVKLAKPLDIKVVTLVAPKLDNPEVTFNPFDEISPAAETPPVKVEVAEPVTPRLEVVALIEVRVVISEVEANRVPVLPTIKFPTTVEEAWETKPPDRVVSEPLPTVKVLETDDEPAEVKPPVSVARPEALRAWNKAVEEAWKGELATSKPALKVEEAAETRPE
jgi:hypothetical protein